MFTRVRDTPIDPLVTEGIFFRVQAILDGRYEVTAPRQRNAGLNWEDCEKHSGFGEDPTHTVSGRPLSGRARRSQRRRWIRVGGSSTTETLSRDLGNVELTAGNGYVLYVTSRKDASALNAANPRIVAEARSWYPRPAIIPIALLVLLGFVLWGLGIGRRLA